MQFRLTAIISSSIFVLEFSNSLYLGSRVIQNIFIRYWNDKMEEFYIYNIQILYRWKKLETIVPSIFLPQPQSPQFLPSTTISKCFALSCNTLPPFCWSLLLKSFALRIVLLFSIFLVSLSLMKLTLSFCKYDLKYEFKHIGTTASLLTEILH